MRLLTATVLTALIGCAAMVAGVHARNCALRTERPMQAAR